MPPKPATKKELKRARQDLLSSGSDTSPAKAGQVNMDELKLQLGQIITSISELKTGTDAKLSSLTDTITTFKNEIRSDIKQIKDEMNEISRSVNFLEGMCEDTKDNLKKAEIRIASVEKDLNSVKSRETLVQKYIVDHDNRVQYLEQIILDTNLVLSNVIQCANENTFELASNIIKKTGITVNDPTLFVISANRIKSKRPTEPGPILVKLGSAAIKKRIMEIVKRDRKVINCSDVGLAFDQPIYFNHHLTPTNQRLLGKARMLKKQKGYHAAFYANGYIWFKKLDISIPIKITSDDDFKNIK